MNAKRSAPASRNPTESAGPPNASAATTVIIGLEDYAGRDVVFIFVSPECPMCRREIRSLVHLARVAQERANVGMALVSDFGPTSTASSFFPRYNPRIFTPFFCFVDSTGQVAACGPVGAGDWLRFRGAWEGTTAHAARQRMAR